jgi:hypothetical protein
MPDIYEWKTSPAGRLLAKMSALACTTNHNLFRNGEFIGQVTVTPQPEGMRAWAILFDRTFPRVSPVLFPEDVETLKQILIEEAGTDE